MSARELRLLSVVAPMLNEEGLAAEFCTRAGAALADLPYEIVVVDDGSSDATPAILDRLADEDHRIRVLHLSRPFGHQMALTAGLDHARGDAVVMIDGDLQDPPELIPELVERWREGADIVVAKRREREGETRFKLATARWFYSLMGRLAQVELEPNAGDFRLFDRGPLDALLRLRERSRFLRGMSSWVGFRRDVVEYDRAARGAGETQVPDRAHAALRARRHHLVLELPAPARGARGLRLRARRAARPARSRSSRATRASTSAACRRCCSSCC